MNASSTERNSRWSCRALRPAWAASSGRSVMPIRLPAGSRSGCRMSSGDAFERWRPSRADAGRVSAPSVRRSSSGLAEVVERDAAEIVATVDDQAGAESVVEAFLDNRQRAVGGVADEIVPPFRRDTRSSSATGAAGTNKNILSSRRRQSLFATLAGETGRKSLQPVVNLCSLRVRRRAAHILVTGLAICRSTFCGDVQVSRMQCLWLTLADPDPATNGQLIYSEGLIRAARHAGASLCVVGLAAARTRRPVDAVRPGMAARRGEIVAAMAAHASGRCPGRAARRLGIDEPRAGAGPCGAVMGGRSYSTASVPAGRCPRCMRHRRPASHGRRGWSISPTTTRSPWRAASPTPRSGLRRLHKGWMPQGDRAWSAG